MAALHPPNFDAFEEYFKRADLDRDGRISGTEAVSFFKGSNLPQPVLAQIWKYSDQNNSGFLGRPEFYNALKLVTVAQSGRELTADIVKAALFGPAATKIPAPQINPVLAPATSINPSVSLIQSGITLPASSNAGVAGPTGFQKSISSGITPGLGANQQSFLSSNSHLVRLPQGAPVPASQTRAVTTSFAGMPSSLSTSSVSTDWFGMNSGVSVGGIPQGSVQGMISSMRQDSVRPTVSGGTPGLAPKPPIPSVVVSPLSTSVPNSNNSKDLVVSGNGFSSAFGMASEPQVNQDKFSPPFSSGNALNSSGTSAIALSQNSKVGTVGPLQSTSTHPLDGNRPPGTQTMAQNNPLLPIQKTSLPALAKLAQDSVSQPQLPWPKITQSNVQKYTNIFVEVDKDRDGKITGEQARNLFLSWGLAREVLKQVWDLADQDSDSMLSFREFCDALYLIERSREGHPLPALLPDMLRFDEAFPQSTSQPSASYGDPIWQPRPGFSHQGFPGSPTSVPITGTKPPMQPTIPYGSSQQRIMPSFRGNLLNQQNREQAIEEATDGHKMPKEVEKKILDSKEKIEYYRSKMQELVLYKSRCDNRLNEITERASADRKEVESLAKKYEEKYKQVAEVASKLTLEEAAFREIQGRKLDLQNAIVNMEKGGSSDGLLQVRADRIQSDLEELTKALHERCKSHGLDIKSNAIIELPFGWQPGIQDGAVDWDEDWDQFDDEGFSVAKDISIELENDDISSRIKNPSVWSDTTFTDGISTVAPISHPYSTVNKFPAAVGRITESETVYPLNENESVRSPTGSLGRSAFETASQEFNSTSFEMNDISPRGKDSHSHGDAESTISGDKFTDDPSWGAAFDANDDVDSVWGFSAKDTDHERTSKNSFFGAEDFGLDHIRVDSPRDTSVFGLEKKSPFFDSLPSTPQVRSSSSPRFGEGPEGRIFNDFSRFDSFGVHDSRFSPKGGGHARFDSISSTNDFGRSRGFSFDETDPFGTGPFRPSENSSPKKISDGWRS